MPNEWRPYSAFFYSDGDEAKFDAAWLKHIHRNSHHWQHWVLHEDSGGMKTVEMPTNDVYEMVADWCGAGRAITGRWLVKPWYESNKEKIILHPRSRKLAEALIESMESYTAQFPNRNLPNSR